jgi:hypothetical protein
LKIYSSFAYSHINGKLQFIYHSLYTGISLLTKGLLL